MWEITSFQSVGPLQLGQPRTAIRSLLGDGFHSFQKTPGENETDVYESLGLHLYYDDDDELELIEAFSPAEIEFEGVSLVGRNPNDVVEDLRANGYEGEQDDVGYNYDAIGIGLTVGGDVVEGVGVFRKGYYD